MPGDGEDGVAERDEGAFLATPFDDPLIAGAEEGGGSGRAGGGGADGADAGDVV